jgi:Flp pilus assembly protein TadD
MRLGGLAFGGKVLGVRFYNLPLTEFFYTRAAKLGEVPLWANYQLSRVNFIKGDQDTAVKYADKELELHPDNCRTNYVRGLAYAYDDKLNSAIENFKRFNTCFPGSWAGHNDLAWLYFRQGDYESARRTIEEVVAKFPTNPWIQNSYGVALMNTGDLKTAVYAFAAADRSARAMTEADWGKAYPGNDAKIYGEGLEAMRKTISENMSLLSSKTINSKE